MLTGLGASLVSAGAGLVSGIGSMFGAKSAASRQREWNEKMYNLQKTDALAQWNRENAYNDPSAQMSRLKKAGLNPDLVYGNGATSLSSSMSMPSAMGYQKEDFSPGFQTIGSAVNQGLQASLLEAEKDVKVAEAEQKRNEAGLSKIELDLKKWMSNISVFGEDTEIPYELATTLAQRDVLNQYNITKRTADSYLKENEIKDVDKALKEIEHQFNSATVQDRIKTVANELKTSEANAKFLVKSLAFRLLGVEADSQTKDFESKFNDPDIVKNLPDGLLTMLKLVKYVLR